MATTTTMSNQAPGAATMAKAPSPPLSPKIVLTYAFFGTEILAAAVLFATEVPRLEGPPLLAALLILLATVSHFYSIQIYSDSKTSISFAFTMALMVLFGAPGAIAPAPLQALAGVIQRRHLDIRALHNAAMMVIVYSSAGAVYSALGDVSPSAMQSDLILATIAASGLSFCLTAIIMACVLNLVQGQPMRLSWEKHAWLAPHYMALGFIGLALAMAYVSLGVFGIVAFLTPAATLRIATKQYLDKTKEQFEKLADQNTKLVRANIEVVRIGEELRQSYDGTLEALVNALDARDQETKGHSMRVSRYMMDIAREMGVEVGSTEWVIMQRGSLLHDVGKIGVSDTILLKAGKLTEEEWKLMRLHPEIGYNMLRQVKFLEGPAEIILAHHERWDGKGYPRGLAEDEIPLGARIFPVVDTFDAMTSDRPYRKALSTQDALNEILKCGGTQFDPRVVEAFLDIYDHWMRMWAEMHDEEGAAESWVGKAA